MTLKKSLPASTPPIIAAPPPWLNETARAEWARVVPAIADLRPADEAVLAAYCQAYSIWRHAMQAIDTVAAQDAMTRGLLIRRGENGAAATNPLVSVSSSAAADMVRLAAALRITPAARHADQVKGRPPPGSKTVPHSFPSIGDLAP